MNQDAIQTTEANAQTEPKVCVQRDVSPQRRKYSPLAVAMIAAGTLGIERAISKISGEPIIVDDWRPRLHATKSGPTKYDIEAIEKAQAKRERKALKKAMRANESSSAMGASETTKGK